MSTHQFRYVPSPAPLKFALIYTATANPSGRMQYHCIRPGQSKERISRTEFITAFNQNEILAIRPLPLPGNEAIFQLEFYV